DDEPDARDFLTMILSDRGADPRGASTVREALEALGPFHPDVLVSDIGMPDEDGYDLIRRIRAGTGDMRGVPALAVTAYAGAEDRRRAIGAGYQMYLAKPFDPDELIGAISHLAGRTPAPLHS
ncbi:MAG: todS, partial [Myxococcaceae bacterium]|nr:todS [Myxococcaceae bacterium]